MNEEMGIERKENSKSKKKQQDEDRSKYTNGQKIKKEMTGRKRFQS
jgi:hypothetical protein